MNFSNSPNISSPLKKSFRARNRASGGQHARRDSKHEQYAFVSPGALAFSVPAIWLGPSHRKHFFNGLLEGKTPKVLARPGQWTILTVPPG